MDEARIDELRHAVLDALQQRAATSMCMLHGKTFLIGHYKAFIELRPVGLGESGRHTLLVKTENTKVRVFRETRAGWFPLPHIATHILAMVVKEGELSQAALRQRHLVRGAEQAIDRLHKQGKVPSNIQLSASATPGAFNLTATALTEDQVKQACATIGPAEAPGDASFWEQLQAEDDR